MMECSYIVGCVRLESVAKGIIRANRNLPALWFHFFGELQSGQSVFTPLFVSVWVLLWSLVLLPRILNSLLYVWMFGLSVSSSSERHHWVDNTEKAPCIYKGHDWRKTVSASAPIPHHTHQRRVSARLFLWRSTRESRLRLFHLHAGHSCKLNLSTLVGKETSKRMCDDKVHLRCEAAGDWVSIPRPGAPLSRTVRSFRSNEVCWRGRRPHGEDSTCEWCHPPSASTRDLQLLVLKKIIIKKSSFSSAPPPHRPGGWRADKSNRLFIL